MDSFIGYGIDILVLIIIYLIVFLKKWRYQSVDKVIINTLMYVYIVMVLYVTLMPIVVSLPFIFNHPYATMNMIPFDDYFLGRGDTIRQIVLNIIMMIPFGFLLPIAKNRKLIFCLLATFIFSLGIEILQPLINGFRSSDITDLITNTFGGFIGYLIHLIFKPLINKILSLLKV